MTTSRFIGIVNVQIFIVLVNLTMFSALLAQSNAGNEHARYLRVTYHQTIQQYLISQYDLSPENAASYIRQIEQMVKGQGLTAKDAYDLFIFENKTAIPDDLIYPYLKGTLLSGKKIIATTDNGEMSFLKSTDAGFLFNHFTQSAPVKVETVITLQEEPKNVHDIQTHRQYYANLLKIFPGEKPIRIIIY